MNLNSNQAIYLQGNIGGNNQPISMLTVNSVDQITIDTPSIFTLNSQNYSGYLVLNQNTVLNAQKIAVQNDFSIGTFEVFIINSDSSENSVILGDITGSGKIIKFGAGTLVLFSVNPFSGTVWVDQGGLSNQTLVTSVFPNASEITLKAGTDSALGSVEFNEFNLLSGQILNGDGHCSCVLIANGNSLVSPGDEIGALSFDGFVMGTGSLLSFDINGTTASISYDQIVAEYVLFLTDDSQNDLQINLGFVPNQGDSFTLIENTGDDSVVGTFANLPEGSYLTINDYIFSISYVGGTGNDIVLTAIGESIVVFVDDDAAAMGDGKNWATAFNTLQDALEAVAANPEFNIDIWVADGVYYPDEGGAQVDNDRNASFTLVDGVSIYGGFFGDETTLNQRDVTTHVTILSGDISQNDINFDGNFIAENVTDIVSNNSYSILNGEYVDTNTFLDGVTVTAGNANGGSYPDNLGAGINCTVQPGPSIHNVIFSANNSIRGAAAMYGCAKNVSNALFISNVSNFSGGAIIAFGITLLPIGAANESLWFVFICGAIAVSALILPGISGSFILLIMGMYSYILHDTLKTGVVVNHDSSALITMIVFGLGLVVGLVTMARFLTWSLKNYKNVTLALLTGFMIGALHKLWPWRVPVTVMDETDNILPFTKGMQFDKIIKDTNVSPFNYLEKLDLQSFLVPSILFFALGIVLVLGLDKFSSNNKAS